MRVLVADEVSEVLISTDSCRSRYTINEWTESSRRSASSLIPAASPAATAELNATRPPVEVAVPGLAFGAEAIAAAAATVADPFPFPLLLALERA